MSEEKRKRAPRTTKKQIETIVNFLEENPILLELKTEPGNYEILKKKWSDLAVILNDEMGGPQKSITQWKGVVSELKTNVRRKAREINLLKKKTGGGPPPKDLNEIEEKLYGLISAVTVEGASEVIEPGIDIPGDIENMFPAQEQQVVENSTDTQEIELPLSSSTSSRIMKRTVPRNSRTKRNSPLQDVLEKQVNSTNEMAKAVASLATAIENLGASLNGLTVAINDFIQEIN